jgi:hypothetical protein
MEQTPEQGIELSPEERGSYLCIQVDGGAWGDPPGWCCPGGC